MIIRQLAYAVAKCFECNNILLYKQADGLPSVCEKCGVRYDMELTQEQRMQMERMQRGAHVHNGGGRYTVFRTG